MAINGRIAQKILELLRWPQDEENQIRTLTVLISTSILSYNSGLIYDVARPQKLKNSDTYLFSQSAVRLTNTESFLVYHIYCR